MKRILKYKYSILLGLTLLLGFILRFWQVGTNPPGLFGDEVDTGYQAYSILTTGRDYFVNLFPVHFQSFGDWRVPLYIYLDTIFIKIFGLTELAVRLPSVILGTLSLFATYLLTHKLTNNKNVAIIATFLLAISPWHIQFSRLGLEVIFLTVLFPFALLLFFKAISSQKNIYFFFSAFLFALTVYAYNTPKLFLFLIIPVVIYLWKKEFFLKKKNILIFFVALFITFIPLLSSLVKGTGQARFLSISIFNDPKVVEKVQFDRQYCTQPELIKLVLHNKVTVWSGNFINNYFNSYSIDFLFLKGDPNPRHSVSNRGELYLFELPFLLAGVYFLLSNCFKKDKYALLIALWLILAPIPAALTENGGNHAIRLFLMLPWLQIVIGMGIYGLWEQLNSKSRKPRIYPWLNVSSPKANQRNSFCCEAVLEDTTALAVEFHKKFYRNIFSAITVLIVILSFLLYLHQYYIHQPKVSGRWWNYGYRQMFKYINSHVDFYEKIYISSNWEPPIVYTLFYGKLAPQKVQKEISFSSQKIDKYIFYSPNLTDAINGNDGKKTLYVLTPVDIDPNNLSKGAGELEVVENILAPDGSVVFKLFANIQNPAKK